MGPYATALTIGELLNGRQNKWSNGTCEVFTSNGDLEVWTTNGTFVGRVKRPQGMSSQDVCELRDMADAVNRLINEEL